MEASISAGPSPEKQPEGDTTTAREESVTSSTTILAANIMKTEFLSKFDDIMSAIEHVRSDITDCWERHTGRDENLKNTRRCDCAPREGENLEGKNKDF